MPRILTSRRRISKKDADLHRNTQTSVVCVCVLLFGIHPKIMCQTKAFINQHGLSKSTLIFDTLVNAFCLDKALNSLRPRQNRRHFADDIFKCIFLNGNVWISINISLKFVPKGPIDHIHIPTLVQKMAWRRGSRRQAIIWTNDGYFTDAYMRHSASMS